MCQCERSYGFSSRTLQPVGTLCKWLSCGPGVVLPCLLTSRRPLRDLMRWAGWGGLCSRVQSVSSPSGEPLFAPRQFLTCAWTGLVEAPLGSPGEPERGQLCWGVRCGLSPLGSLSRATGAGLLPVHSCSAVHAGVCDEFGCGSIRPVLKHGPRSLTCVRVSVF